MANFQRNMASDREGFKNKLEEHLGGALGEFYKARLAAKNGQIRWVLHWQREAFDLVERAVEVFVDHEIKGFKDKTRALNEVMEHLHERDHSYRKRATNAVLRDYHVRRLLKKLDAEDTEEFWLMVANAAKVPRRA